MKKLNEKLLNKDFLLLVGFFALTIGANSWACEARSLRQMNLFIDLESNGEYFYNRQHVMTQRPSLSIDSCMDTVRANKYLMIGLAQENPVLTNETQGFVLNELPEPLICKIHHSEHLDSPQVADERLRRLENRRNFLNRCVQVQVTDLNSSGIKYPNTQPGCEIERVSTSSVNFTGPFCFFTPKLTSHFLVHIQVKKECRNKEKLTTIFDNDFKLDDLNLLLNTYVAGNPSGSSPDLTALSVTQVRLSYNPLSSLMPVSEDFGDKRPLWPSEWRASNVHLGALEISTVNRMYDDIRLPLLVDARCEENCVDGICASPCNYSAPLAAEFGLYELKNGRQEFIKLWYDGGVAPANYFGLIYGLGSDVPKHTFETGKRYRIEAIIDDPQLDYAFFAGRVKRLISLNNNHLRELHNNGRINRIPHINTIGTHEPIPGVPRIRGLNFVHRPFDNLSHVLNTFRSHLDNSFWPPIFTSLCSQDGLLCRRVSPAKVVLQLDFTIEEERNGRFVLSQIQERRISNIGGTEYNRPREIQPLLGCTRDGSPPVQNDIDDDFDWGNF